MPSLDDVVRGRTSLDNDDREWLHRLVADWQILADLSFADLLLWLPDRRGTGFWAAAQMRPTTGPTAYIDDLVGGFAPGGSRPLLDLAWSEQRIVREGDPEWRDDVPVRLETIPVRRGAAVLGVIARNTNLLGVRTPSRLELAYLRTAGDLTQMIASGEFPSTAERSDLADAIRVGDGFVRSDAAGFVEYASPNAVSAFRRLGWAADLVGSTLAEVVAALVPASPVPTDEVVASVLDGRTAREAELENSSAALVLRSIPLSSNGHRIGALVLMREVTELRRRERELMTKEATIREIHHRVKNNLQTVAALLRLQARRLDVPAGRAALAEAERRVGSIALVHELLSKGFDEAVEFDEVADRLRGTVVELSTSPGLVTTSRTGSFGLLPADLATSLALALTEIMQNAVEHGFAGGSGHLGLMIDRSEHQLRLQVSDDGAGLPPGFDPRTRESLGMSIMLTIIEGELGGTLTFSPRTEGGTQVDVQLRWGDDD